LSEKHLKKRNKALFEIGFCGLFLVFILVMFSIDTFAQARDVPEIPGIPADFQGDGCTHFPDGDYADCCFEHDKAYYVGGSWKMRWRADKKLYQCVAAKRGFKHKLIAPIMWAGVRVFGVPFLPTQFRWGFGRKKISN